MKMYFWKQAWLKAPLLLCLAAGQVQAATITADGNCTLADAITAANTDTATGNCISGDAGKDTIELTYSPLLSGEPLSQATDGLMITLPPPATPSIPPIPHEENMLLQISTEIFINGNRNTINANKDSVVGSVLYVSSNGNLTLNETTITGGTGYISEDGYRHGGGIYSNGGSLTLNNSTVSGNLVTGYGGGILINDSIVTLTNSTVSGNEGSFGGGGIHSDASTLTLTNSTVNENSSPVYGVGGDLC